MADAKAATGFYGHAGALVSLAFILVIVVAMGAAGWITLREGSTRFLLPFTTDNATQQVTAAVEAARRNPDPASLRAVSEEMWGLSKLTDAKRFTDSRLMEQGIYYTTMPRTNQVLMLVHVLFAAFCMLLGGLQFWPAFRKRFMKAHRTVGAIYIITVPVGVVTAMAYMALTPPHHIYDHLVAWIALWVFGALALFAIAMAVRGLRQRRIFEHQAWMALSFGCLMVAPLLRMDWALLAWIFPAIDQETLNLVTVGMMLPEVLLIAYGLILVNRQYARPMKQRVAAPIAGPSRDIFLQALPLLQALGLLLLGSNIFFYLAGAGMSSMPSAQALIPAALLAREQAVLLAYPLATGLFAISTGLAFFAVLFSLGQLLQNIALPARGSITALLGLLAGLSSCFIGWHIGLVPERILFSGGTLYMVNGLVLTGFSLLLLCAGRVGQHALMKESLVFLLCLLPFPTLFFLTLYVVSHVSLPADYIAAGQGFVIPVGFSAGLLFLAMFYVVYGQATREHN
ncbi:MAG TPA: DUF2306 domain-containing protein [Moraxellaceae bacterium]